MKKSYFIGICLIIFISVSARSQTDKFDYHDLSQPRIVKIQKKQKMLIAEAKGNPLEFVSYESERLSSAYEKLNIGSKPEYVGVRFKVYSFDKPIEWIMTWGMPIPDNIHEIPDDETEFSDIKIDYWSYGDVAEIVHKGPYEEEFFTIKILMKFIEDSGYEIIGPLENISLKGPEGKGKDNQDDYLTIIRFNVRKK
jgi:hypothetical protein